MSITIQLFAALKEYYNPQIELDWEQGTLAELKEALLDLNPQSSKLLDKCRFAVNEEFVGLSQIIKSNDHVAIIPPSSGG